MRQWIDRPLHRPATRTSSSGISSNSFMRISGISCRHLAAHRAYVGYDSAHGLLAMVGGWRTDDPTSTTPPELADKSINAQTAATTSSRMEPAMYWDALFPVKVRAMAAATR